MVGDSAGPLLSLDGHPGGAQPSSQSGQCARVRWQGVPPAGGAARPSTRSRVLETGMRGSSGRSPPDSLPEFLPDFEAQSREFWGEGERRGEGDREFESEVVRRRTPTPVILRRHQRFWIVLAYNTKN